MFVDNGSGELSGGDEGGLVAHVGDVGAGETGCQGGQLSRNLILVKVCFQATQVHLEYRCSALQDTILGIQILLPLVTKTFLYDPCVCTYSNYHWLGFLTERNQLVHSCATR